MKDEIKEFFKGCLFPQVSLEHWAKIYDFELDTIECPHCNKELKPTHPIAMKDYRGYIYEQCVCKDYPKNQAPFRYTPIDLKERQSIANMFKEML